MNFVLFFSILLVVVIVLFCVAIAVACVQVAAFDKDEYYRPKKSEENQKRTSDESNICIRKQTDSRVS